MTIYIAIPSYRDSELLATLRDCIEKARWPNDLRFGLCWQHDGSETLGPFGEDSRVKFVEYDYKTARGTCWARRECSQFYNGEDYFFSLDAHHRFTENWDAENIAMVELAGSDKCVLSTYLPPYTPSIAPDFDVAPTLMMFHRFNADFTIGRVGVGVAGPDSLERPVPGRFYSAHYAFAPGNFLLEVPPDPEMYHNGEEDSIAIRAFTRGWDFFHPNKTTCLHYFGRTQSPKHWSDHDHPERTGPTWWKLNARSNARYYDQLFLDLPEQKEKLGAFSLGEARTLREYEKYAGVKFDIQGVQQHTLVASEPPSPTVYASEVEWQDSFLKTLGGNVDIASEVIGGLGDDAEIALFLFDSAGQQVCEHGIEPKLVSKLQQTEDPRLGIRYLAHHRADHWQLVSKQATSAQCQILQSGALEC